MVYVCITITAARIITNMPIYYYLEMLPKK